MNLPEDFDLDEYAQSLYERLDEAVELYWGDCGDDEWQPIENDCHGNVTELCAMDSSVKPVRGWLIYDLDGINRIRFVAHSVVEFEDGNLYDITPPNSIQRPPFIVANDSAEFFECLVMNIGDFDYEPK